MSIQRQREQLNQDRYTSCEREALVVTPYISYGWECSGFERSASHKFQSV